MLDLEVGFRDPGVELFGLRNAVIPVGDTFLEVVSPIKEGTTAGRLLEFDPVRERFIGDVEADRLLTREYRAPFVIPEKV